MQVPEARGVIRIARIAA